MTLWIRMMMHFRSLVNKRMLDKKSLAFLNLIKYIVMTNIQKYDDFIIMIKPYNSYVHVDRKLINIVTAFYLFSS